MDVGVRDLWTLTHETSRHPLSYGMVESQVSRRSRPWSRINGKIRVSSRVRTVRVSESFINDLLVSGRTYYYHYY